MNWFACVVVPPDVRWRLRPTGNGIYQFWGLRP